MLETAASQCKEEIEPLWVQYLVVATWVEHFDEALEDQFGKVEVDA